MTPDCCTHLHGTIAETFATIQEQRIARPQDRIIATLHKRRASTPQERLIATPQERLIATPQERLIATPQERPIATPQERPIATPQGLVNMLAVLEGRLHLPRKPGRRSQAAVGTVQTVEDGLEPSTVHLDDLLRYTRGNSLHGP